MRNHLAKVCQPGQKKPGRRNVNTMHEEPQEDHYLDEHEVFVGHLFVGYMRDRPDWTEQLMLGRHLIIFKLDTGASANVLPLKEYKAILKTLSAKQGNAMKTGTTRNVLTGIGDGKIRPTGIVQLDCTCKETTYHLTFYVTDGDLAILGKESCEKLDLIRRVDRISTTSTPQLPARMIS